MLLLMAACIPPDKAPEGEEDQALARVYNRTLYQSEVAEMLPEEYSPEDSSLLVNAFVERWIRESLVLHAAEKNIPADLNIDELVRNYRSSLLRHNYERMLVENNLDSTITQQQFEGYYQNNKERFILEEPIVQALFIRVPNNAPQINEAKSWWKNLDANYAQLLEFANLYAEQYLMSDTVWHKQSDIKKLVPKSVLGGQALNEGKRIIGQEGPHTILVNILKYMPAGQSAPLGYVKEEIQRTLWQEQKVKLLEENKEKLYEVETRRNNVEVFRKE